MIIYMDYKNGHVLEPQNMEVLKFWAGVEHMITLQDIESLCNLDRIATKNQILF